MHLPFGRCVVDITPGRRSIGDPVPGKTISSPSDFGFAVTRDGGIFVCSTAGPLNWRFQGPEGHEGGRPVRKGSLEVKGKEAKVTGNATVVLVPGMDRSPLQVISNTPYSVTGPGKGWLS